MATEIQLPVLSGNRLPIKESRLAELKKRFPLVDVEVELKDLQYTLENNP